jgi:hypothetical protein
VLKTIVPGGIVMRIGSIGFHSYNENLRRIYWLELVEEQVRRANSNEVRLSLVAPPCEIEAEHGSHEDNSEAADGLIKKV